MFAVLIQIPRICFARRVVHINAPNAARAIMAIARQNPDATILGVCAHSEALHV